MANGMWRTGIFILIFSVIFITCGENLEDPNPPARPQWVEQSLPYDTTESGVDADPDGDKINLEWPTGSEDDLNSYQIYRASGSAENKYSLIDEVDAVPVTGAVNEFVDGNILIGTQYYYFCRSVDQAGNLSPHSDTITYKLIQKVNLLSPSGTISITQPTFRWTDMSSSASEYVIRVEQISPHKVIWLSAITRQNYTIGDPQSLIYGGGEIFYLAQASLTQGINYRWRVDAIATFDRNGHEIAGSESNWGLFIIQ